MGRSFKVQNTAGPSGHQAVAVRVSADQVIFYRCIFEGWQSTLHAHTFRHLYRECTISGTVDFIFGNAAAAFQSCNITAKNIMQPTEVSRPHSATFLYWTPLLEWCVVRCKIVNSQMNIIILYVFKKRFAQICKLF